MSSRIVELASEVATHSFLRVCLPFCLLGNFSRFFFAVCRFFQNQLFQNILSALPSECQTVWILSGLI